MYISRVIFWYFSIGCLISAVSSYYFFVCVKSDNNFVFESILKNSFSTENNWNSLWTSPWRENNTKAKATDVWCFYDFFFFFFCNSRFFHVPWWGFWSVTGHSAGQAGSWLLQRRPKWLLPWPPPSNPDKLLRQTWYLPMVWPRVNFPTPRVDLPIFTIGTAAFTHFPQSRLGQQTKESVCPSHLPPHHWSLPQRLYSLLWSKAWKSINKWGKDRWRSKATRAMKIRSSNDAYLPLPNLMVTNRLKNQLTFQQVQG